MPTPRRRTTRRSTSTGADDAGVPRRRAGSAASGGRPRGLCSTASCWEPGPQGAQGQVQGQVLGFLWTLVRPLMQLLVYSVAIGMFLGAGRRSPTSASTCSPACSPGPCSPRSSAAAPASIVGNAGLVKKVYFPRELFPLVGGRRRAVNFALQLVVLLGAYVVTGPWPGLGNLLLRARSRCSSWSLFATALGLLLAAATSTCATSSTSSRSACCSGSGCRRSSTPGRRCSDTLHRRRALQWLVERLPGQPDGHRGARRSSGRCGRAG